MISSSRILIPANVRTLLWTADKDTKLTLHSYNSSVFVGDITVTYGNGFQVICHIYLTLEMEDGDSLYAISDTPAIIEVLAQTKA